MTEALHEGEDFEVEEVELDDDHDEQERTAQVSAEIAAWERETGVQLSDEDFNRAGDLLALYGIPPSESYAETAQGRFEADFATVAESIEREQGRKLADSELDRMWDAAQTASEDPSIETDAAVWNQVKRAARNLDDSDARAEHISELLNVPQETEEPSATVVHDDGRERPGFNLDSSSERAAAIDALMAGEDVSTYDSDSEPIGDK
jgi:hypothetical protein